MDKYELEAKYNIAETCVASISLDDLKALSEDKSTDIWCSSTKLTVRLFFAVMTSPFVARSRVFCSQDLFCDQSSVLKE